MNKFLTKSWVYPFYKTYAGFLFAVFLFAAGLLRGVEHLALASFFTSNFKNLIYPLAGFIMYELLTLHFSIKWVSDVKNRIIRSILFLDFRPRFKLLLNIVLYLQIPVVLYSVFLLIVALFNGQIIVPMVILTLSIIRFALYALILNRIFIFPIEKAYKHSFRFRIPAVINFPIINFSLTQIFTQRLLSLILSKVISIGLLIISIILIETIDYYERFSALAIFMIFLANAFLSFDLFRFHNIDLNIFRSFPIKPWHFLIQTFSLMIILALPEIIIIYRNFLPITGAGFITMHIINGLLVLLFLYSYLLYFNIELKDYIMRIFWASIFMSMLLLFDIPVYLLLIILCSFTFYFYFKGYYSFEMVYNQKNDK